MKKNFIPQQRHLSVFIRQQFRIKGALSAIAVMMLMVSCVTKAPDPVGALPTAEQVAWHQLETYAFIHFGITTFNDVEWGYGNEAVGSFNPTEIDCEQWVQTLKACGMKAVILTAKHCDGFSLWPTKTNDYNISNTPFDNGRGDLVGALSAACRKHGLKFGLYLSPWDRHDAEYGRPDYVKTYHAQIEELIENYSPIFEFWFDGANGGNGWYGGANETRAIDAKTYYDYEKARDIIVRRNPEAMVFGGTVPTIRWVGNEKGWADATQWSTASLSDFDKTDFLPQGNPHGDAWIPAEADVSIRPGWFYHHREDHQVKSVAQLLDIYYNTVGHNTTLLLNFPVNTDGRITAIDSMRAVEWHRRIMDDFDDNLLKNSRVVADNERGKRYAAPKVNDGKWDSYWATEDGVNKGELVFSFQELTRINRVVLQEYIPLGQRVERFSMDYFINGKWLPVEAYDEMTTIGYKRIVRFKTIEAERLRVRFKQAKGPLCICNVEAYCAAPMLSEPTLSRDFNNVVTITNSDRNAWVFYTMDGSEPSMQSVRYLAPFVLEGKATLKAVAIDPVSHQNGPVAAKYFDLPTTEYHIITPNDDQSRKLCDGNVLSFLYLNENERIISIQLKEKHSICGFRYLPDQSRDAQHPITHYKVTVDGRVVCAGEFSNIVNNPIEQEVRFTPVVGTSIVFEATGFARDAQGSVAEFSLITE